MRKTKLSIIDDELFESHVPFNTLPERRIRTQSIRRQLKEPCFQGFADGISWITPQPISRDELERIHSPDYVAEVFDQCAKVELASSSPQALIEWISHDAEVPVSAGSLNAILHGAGSAQQAVRLVMSGDTKRVFCNIRPPGHHAHYSKGQGFCVFNNIWIARCEALKQGAKKVAIIDWDVHNGNGTQDFIARLDPEIDDTLFFTLDQAHRTIWPHINALPDRRIHCAEFEPCSGDDVVKQYFDNELLPTLCDFAPDVILISCGFDAHISEEISQLCYSTELYGWMTERLVEVANKCCDGRVVSMLEGGYCIEALVGCALVHIEAML